MENPTITIRCSEAYRDQLGRDVVALNTDISKYTRLALKLSRPLIMAMPWLLRTIPTDDLKGEDIIARRGAQ